MGLVALQHVESKEIEESSRMGKTKIFLRKLVISREHSSKMGTIKDNNGKELTEAEEVKKNWKKYTEELYKDLNDPENHDGVVTQLEPDILDCEVKWALGSITTTKASAGDEILDELFKILKDDAIKVLHSTCQQIWKTAVATGLEKVTFNSIPKER